MEPISALLIAGVSAALKDTASQAVKDAYQGLKTLIKKKYAQVDLEKLEKKPDSKKRQDVVQEELQRTGAEQDPDIVAKVQELIATIEAHPQDIVGVDLENVKAANLRLHDTASSGSGVKVKEGEFSGDIEISGVRAGTQEGLSQKKN